MELSQVEKLYNLLKDGKPHRTDEIVKVVYGNGLSLARVGARVWDVKHKYGVNIKGWHDIENAALYWYQIDRREEPKPIDCSKMTDDDVERLFSSAVNKLTAFDLKSIEFATAYKRWTKALPKDKETCKRQVVFLYQRLTQ